MIETSEITIISKEIIFIKARMLSEGVRIHISEETIQNSETFTETERINFLREVESTKREDLYDATKFMELKHKANLINSQHNGISSTLIFDNSNIITNLYPNKHSRMDLIVEGKKVSISEDGEILLTGRFPKKPKWRTEKLSNGLPIDTALPAASAGIINVVFTVSCMNYNTNKGCRYCNLFANPISRKISMLPMDTLGEWSKYQAEAVKIATDHGWKGGIAISGGALAPAQRKEYLQRLSLVLTTLRETLGEKKYSKIRKTYNHYPPEDFADMHKWKQLGINGTSIDLEVMDPAYFAAICPGKSAYKPYEYWKKAQEESVKVFGPWFGTTGCIVMGIEPMSTLIKGMDERFSKGIFSQPLVFHSTRGSDYWGFRPPTAEWIVEATDKIVDSFLKHAPKYMINLFSRRMAPSEPNKRRRNFSNRLNIVYDEIQRRLQNISS